MHYRENGFYGPYWSVTKYKDIMHGRDQPRRLLVRLDARRHRAVRPADWNAAADVHRDGPAEARRAAQGGAARSSRRRNLQRLESTDPRAHRQACSTNCRAARPSTGCERVSIELTTQMLATLFDFPFEDRRKLTYWSDVATSVHRAPATSSSPRKRGWPSCCEMPRLLHAALERARQRGAEAAT